MLECPNCGMDNAYCDGVNSVCPDCGYEWDCLKIPNDDDWEGEDED